MFEQPQRPGGPVPPTQPTAQPAASKPLAPSPADRVTPPADDMFAATDPASKSSSLGGSLPTPVQPIAAVASSRTPWLWIGIGVVVLAALIGGGIWLTVRSPQEAPIADAVPSAAEVTEETTEALPVEVSEAPIEETPAVTTPVDDTDTDRDGLTDADEVSFGTDPLNADTDADGLSDSAEVRVYKTNPLDPDSDDDTYLDGAEVRAGFDPNGPGRLQDIQRALNNQ